MKFGGHKTKSAVLAPLTVRNTKAFFMLVTYVLVAVAAHADNASFTLGKGNLHSPFGIEFHARHQAFAPFLVHQSSGWRMKNKVHIGPPVNGILIHKTFSVPAGKTKIHKLCGDTSNYIVPAYIRAIGKPGPTPRLLENPGRQHRRSWGRWNSWSAASRSRGVH